MENCGVLRQMFAHTYSGSRLRLAPRSAACGLLRDARTTDSPGAAKSAIGGLTKAVERLEMLIHDRDRQIMDLRDRVHILEEKRAG